MRDISYCPRHYTDVTMSPTASQITSLGIVYSTVYSGADQRKHQSSASLAFAWGIHRGPVNSPHKKASNAENVFIWWRHHVWCREDPKWGLFSQFPPVRYFPNTMEPLWKDQQCLTEVTKFCPFPRAIPYKSCLFYPSSKATSFERLLFWVAFIEGFHCICYKTYVTHWIARSCLTDVDAA